MSVFLSVVTGAAVSITFPLNETVFEASTAPSLVRIVTVFCYLFGDAALKVAATIPFSPGLIGVFV